MTQEVIRNGNKYLHRMYNEVTVAHSIHRDRTRTVVDTLFHRGLLFVVLVHSHFENDFYKQVYKIHDFSFASIASENTKDTKKEVLTKGLNIVKNFK